MQIDQVAIAVLGAAAAWLSQERRTSWRRWACVFGMVGQPFWFWATWHADQWGMFVLSAFYMAAWMRGAWVHWVAPHRARVAS